MKRWQLPAFEQIVQKLDPAAQRGKSIQSLDLNVSIFNSLPEAHPTAVCRPLRELYDTLERSAREDDRLPANKPLVRNWTLTYDIYSPKLGRFIEVDERQHFSRQRLDRIVESQFLPGRSLYPSYFWDQVIQQLQKSPACDIDPPHRDEQRTYRDVARELLPTAYGLEATIRLDEYSLSSSGLEAVDLIQQILNGKAR